MSADGAVTDDTTDIDDGAEGAANEGGEPAEGAAATPEQRETRKERRRNEFQAAQESAREAREELARERGERERLAARVAEMDGRQRERDAQAERDRKDPYADQIAKLEDEAQTHLEAVGNAKDPAKQREHLKQYHAKMREAAKLDFKRDAEEAARKNPPQQQNGGLGAREVAIMTSIEGEFPTFVQQDKQGAEFRALADLHLNRLMASGKPYGLATIRAACAAAASEMKIGGKSTGSPNRGRFGASGAGDGAGGSGESDRGGVPIGRTEEALAIALANRDGKGLTKEQAIANFTKRVGPGIKRRMSDE